MPGGLAASLRRRSRDVNRSVAVAAAAIQPELGDSMSTFRETIAAAAVFAGVCIAGPVLAQSRPTPVAVDQVEVQGLGTINVYSYKAQFVSADPVTRRVVLEDPAGRRWAVIAPPLLGDLSLFRNGETLIIRVAPGTVTALGKARQGRPGEVLSEVALNAGLPGWPEGFGIREVVLTTIFVDINKQAGTITFEGPDGGVRTLRAANGKVLADLQNVEPGDLSQITYLEGITINAVR